MINKNHIFLIFKGAFLAKMKQIDANGQNQIMMTKIANWIDLNWEDMYEEMMSQRRKRKAKNDLYSSTNTFNRRTFLSRQDSSMSRSKDDGGIKRKSTSQEII